MPAEQPETTAARMRAWTGPAVLGFGFRPFFLLGPLWAALAMAVWTLTLAGAVQLPLGFDPVGWHAHALLFGYVWAVVAGFLTTAVPNWTGRFPILGWPLAGLVGLWLLGRGVSVVGGLIPWPVAMAADLAFPVAFTAAIAREVIAGRSWRNLKVLVLLSMLVAANAGFHLEAAAEGSAAQGYAIRAGLAAVLALIALIGGRIVPSFTRNWLAARGATRLPHAPDRGDDAAMAVTLAALGLWVLWPAGIVTAGLCLAAGAANLWRLARWCGLATLAEPLLFVLHMAYAMLVLGFLATGAAAAGWLAATGAQHLWMAGAIGLMTLAVMSRASLGHCGRPLRAGPAITLLYVALTLSVVLRLTAAAAPGLPWLLHLSATAWIVAMGGFSVLFAPLLLRPRDAPRRANPTPSAGKGRR